MAAHWPLALAVVIGAALRLYMLAAHSLLLDEAFVAIGARDILRNHTPMWDAISNAPFVWTYAHLVGLSGLDNLSIVRLPGALLGTASIIMVYAIGWRMFDRRVANLAAFAFAIHPFAIAFARLLFADRFQVFFMLVGMIAIDRFADKRAERPKYIAGQLALVALLWACAFLMKYNAVVPAAIWLIAGSISGRYSWFRSALCLMAITDAAVFTLAIWPYDAPIWLAAFLEKGGSYNVPMAYSYFVGHMHLILFGATEIAVIGGLLFGLMFRNARGRSFAHTALFILLYVTCVIVLGRRFQRYLLIVAPIAAILIAALANEAFHFARRATDSVYRVVGYAMTAAIVGAFVYGAIQSASRYIDYLHNDVDRAAITRIVLQGEASGKRAFWLLPEPIGAYYLGFTQHYSRAVRPGLDGPRADQNYFEWSALPYSEEWKSYSVLNVRRAARTWGLGRIITSPRLFIDTVNGIIAAGNAQKLTPSIDYLTSDSVRAGDLLVVQSGMMDVQQEPILETIDPNATPPMLSHLPLDRFRVLAVYRPEGLSSTTDTTLDKLRAGAWILERK